MKYSSFTSLHSTVSNRHCGVTRNFDLAFNECLHHRLRRIVHFEFDAESVLAELSLSTATNTGRLIPAGCSR